MVGYLLSYGISLGLFAVVLAAIFKILPDVKMSWSDVWVGALVTSVLFHAGKFGISVYIGKAGVASTFGAAGALAVLLVWVYYSSLIVLYGAEFTRVYANRHGSHVVPDGNAIQVPETPWRARRWKSRSSAARCRARHPSLGDPGATTGLAQVMLGGDPGVAA